MSEIVITEFMDEAAVADLRKHFEVIYNPELFADINALAPLLNDCKGLIVRNQTQVRGELLSMGGQLKVVGRLGVGLDNIDVAGCEQRGIEVIPATGANVLAVAEYVWAGCMMLLRGAYQSTAQVTSGEWPRNALVGSEIAGKSLGLIGFGSIGQAVAQGAGALGMQVQAHDPALAPTAPVWSSSGTRPAAFDDVLATSDILSLHVPLTPQTKRLIDAHALQQMRRGAALINTARGGVVDETALADALKSGQLCGAMLDVFENEPLTANSPLADAPNLIATAHIAGVTKESNVRVSDMIARRVTDTLRAAS